MVKFRLNRFLIKAVTWRIVAFTAIALIAYLMTGSINLALTIGLVDWVIKSILYIVHELVWSRIYFGISSNECKRGAVVWFTGLSGSGKTTIADIVKRKLDKSLIKNYRLDGDVARKTFSRDLGFSKEDRAQNCLRAAGVASFLKRDSIVLASFISPYDKIRNRVREVCGKDDTYVVYVKCDITECEKRDPKGMYAKVFNGRFKGVPFTGKHPKAPYETPFQRHLTLLTEDFTAEECAEQVIDMLKKKGHI